MKTIGSFVLAAFILFQSGGLKVLSSAFERAATLDSVLQQAAQVVK